jgi:hypothetical protein
MNATFLHEPELEFGNGGTHVDIRYGLLRYGPLDVGDTTAPSRLRVGLIGTEETISEIEQWFDRCKEGIAAKQSRLTNLFPSFPGFSETSKFQSCLVFHNRWRSPIRQREIDAVLQHTHGEQMVREFVSIFLDHAATLIEGGGPMVLVCVPPIDLLAAVDGVLERRTDSQDQELDEGSEVATIKSSTVLPFHDLLKAEGMRLGLPIQMVRPSTYGVQLKRSSSKRRSSATPLQDEATRAWNIHTALYYKAGGVPWRLLRSASDLATCFVGISFYRTLEGDRLLTSVAQVFNERGEGVIVKGAQAEISKDDRQPHLSEEDAKALLKNAINIYRKEHRTSPARLVVHKTSKLTSKEESGFEAAAEEHQIDVVELLSMKRSLTRLFREGAYPPKKKRRSRQMGPPTSPPSRSQTDLAGTV